jgi:nitric oxide reductase NorE protein
VKAPGIWIFIALDCTSFGLLFFVFMAERFKQAMQFDASARLLDFRLGFANTLILITSSWLVARATGSAHAGNFVGARRWLATGLVVASGFAVIKCVEYSRAIAGGHADLADEFFTFYFALTGVHLFHYLIGMGVLVYLTAGLRARSGPDTTAEHLRLLDGGALFWHTVDLLWISLFAMLYLIGAR